MVNGTGQLICHFCKASMRLKTIEPQLDRTIAKFDCAKCGGERVVQVVSVMRTATKAVVKTIGGKVAA